MYLAVTQAVGADLGQGFFADPAFMTTLDVTFANLYFAAAQATGTPAAVRWPGARWWNCAARPGSSRSSSPWPA